MADEEKTEEKANKKDLGKLMGIMFAALNLLVLSGGAFLVYSSTLGYSTKVVGEEELNKELVQFREKLQANSVLFTMPEFNTNLDGIPRRLINIELSLEMLDENGFEEVVTQGAEPRDAIMKVLNGKKYHQLETVQGKLRLKNQIIAGVNARLKRGVVKNVYFSKFIIQ